MSMESTDLEADWAGAGGRPRRGRRTSIEMVGQALLQLVQNVMLGERVSALGVQRLLGLPYVLLGKLGADEAPEAVRLDVLDADLGSVLLDQLPGGRLAEWRRGGPASAASPSGEDIWTLDWASLHPGHDQSVGLFGERGVARLGVVL